MKKMAMLTFCLLFLSTACLAENIYIAQSSQGTSSGVDCANARSAAWFNTASNWSNPKQTGKIGPADTVHLCGTISSTLSAKGGGFSGAPVTILFENGAKISQPHCDNENGCLNTGGQSFLTIDGGTNGMVEATATGTGLAYQQKGTGIVATGSSNLEIKNLSIQNIYVHSSQSDTIDQDPPEGCVYWGGSTVSNILVHDNICHDSKWGFNMQWGNGSNIQFYNNNIYNVDHGITLGGYGPVTVTGIKIFNNHIHDYSNWDTGAANAYHHDGIHVFANNGAHANNGMIYNNLFSGATGYGNGGDYSNFTSHIYIEKDGETCNNWKIFNNVFLPPPTGQGRGFGFIAIGSNTGTEIYNNTIIGNCKTLSSCYGILVNGGDTKVKNNILVGFNAAILFYAAAPSTTWDYNIYANVSSYGQTISPYGDYTTFSSWQNHLQSLNASNETHGRSTNNALLDSNGLPQANSPAIGSGLNLSKAAIPGITYDKIGILRPASGPWTVGAYNNQTSLPAPVLSVISVTE